MRIANDITAVKKRAAAAFEDSGKSQEDAAKAIGVSQSTLWNFLYGKTKNFGNIVELCRYFEITLDWLMTGRKSALKPNAIELKEMESLTGQVIEAIERAAANFQIGRKAAMAALAEVIIQHERAAISGDSLSAGEIDGIIKAIARRNDA